MNNQEYSRRNNDFAKLGIVISNYDLLNLSVDPSDIHVMYKDKGSKVIKTLSTLTVNDIKRALVSKESSLVNNPDKDNLYREAVAASKRLSVVYGEDANFTKLFYTTFVNSVTENETNKINNDYNYYSILGLKKSDIVDNSEIFKAVGKKLAEIDHINGISKDKKAELEDEIYTACFVLMNEDLRNNLKCNKGFNPLRDRSNGTIDNTTKFTKVSSSDDSVDAKKTAKKGSKFIKRLTTGAVVTIIVVSSLVGLSMIGNSLGRKKNKDDKIILGNDKKIEQEEESVAVINEDELSNSDIEENVVVENTDMLEEESVSTLEAIDNDEVIAKTTDKVYEMVNSIGGNINYDRDEIEALVRYTRHDNPNYTGESVYSNEYAYDCFFELINTGKINIANFYENLSSYNNVNELSNALSNIDPNNGSYEDEFNAYDAIDKSINNMDKSDYAEVVGVRALVDSYVNRETMCLARGGAEETGQEYYMLDNNGNVLVDENGNPIETLYSKNIKAVDSTKASMCKSVYDRVDLNNDNSILTKLALEALDEDENRTASRAR